MALRKKNYAAGGEGPARRVRVLDLSRLVAGNTLTQVLGDFGAEVIKVEPPAGDTLRAWQTQGRRRPTGRSTRATRRASASSCASPKRASCCCSSCRRRAVFVESFRPGTLEKMGLGPEVLLAAQPEARHRAHLGLRPGRARIAGAPASARWSKACRASPRSTASPTASRCCRRCTSPTRIAGPLRRDRRDDRAARSRAERRQGPGDRPAAARSAVRRARPAGGELPPHRQGEAAHRQPLDQRRARATPTAARTATTCACRPRRRRWPSACSARSAAPTSSTIRATAPTPSA